MTITIVLTAEDYLTHQLFTASVSKEARKKRLKSWLVIVCLCFLTAFALYFTDDPFLSSYALVFGIICLIFYPAYQRAVYRNVYKKHILKNYSYRFGKEALVNFQHDYVDVKNITYEGKLFTSEIKEINEIGTHYFINFKAGESLIVPKSQVDQTTFLTEILSIFRNPNIVVQKQLDWRWK